MEVTVSPIHVSAPLSLFFLSWVFLPRMRWTILFSLLLFLVISTAEVSDNLRGVWFILAGFLMYFEFHVFVLFFAFVYVMCLFVLFSTNSFISLLLYSLLIKYVRMHPIFHPFTWLCMKAFSLIMHPFTNWFFPSFPASFSSLLVYLHLEHKPSSTQNVEIWKKYTCLSRQQQTKSVNKGII